MPQQQEDETRVRATIKCPCCGDVGAEADEHGLFVDGQSLICGCAGWLSVTEDDAWVNNGGEPCPPEAKCQEPDERERR